MSSAPCLVVLVLIVAACASRPTAVGVPIDEAPHSLEIDAGLGAVVMVNPEGRREEPPATPQLAPVVKQPVVVVDPPSIPEPGPNGCLDPARHAEYVRSLEAHANKAFENTLAGEGAVTIERQGFIVGGRDDEIAVGVEYETKGKRFAIVGSSEFGVKVSLAKFADTLRLIERRPHSHQVVVKVCGLNPCPRGRGTQPAMEPLAIELQPGESMGPPLVLTYDTWWAFATYTKRQRCRSVP